MSGITRFKWNGPALEAFNERQLQRGLDAAWIEFQRMCRKRAGIANTGKVIKKKGGQRRGAGGRFVGNKTQRTIYPNSSKPGESVRRRTGIGQKNIVGGRRGMRARVGYTAIARYMTFHELGIRYSSGIQQRPTIIPTLSRNRDRLARIMARAAQRTKP